MKMILLILAIVISLTGKSQVGFDHLDINNVKARINADGSLFSDYANWIPSQFEIPKGSGKSTILAGNLWIGGIDVGGMLKVAAQTYRQTGQDFYCGPTPNPVPPQWNRVWKINKSTVDSFRLGLTTPIPQIILDWPGNGNTAIGQAQNLAPYVDLNSDNIYDPTVGDYPCIRGDQTLYFIFNDNGPHTESGGQMLPVEIHGMAYAFNNSADTALNHSFFLNYRMISRSAFPHDSVYVGMWTDFDLGCYSDDYIACDVERSMYYINNGDKEDDVSCISPGYGKFPPAQAVIFINGPDADLGDVKDNDHDCQVDESGEKWVMSNFLYYDPVVQFPPNGAPSTPNHYYGYLKSIWRDGMHVSYGGGGSQSGSPDCTYMFPGASDQIYGWGTGGNCITTSVQNPWDEISAGNAPQDKRGVGSYGPFTLMPGEEVCFDFAYVWARTKDTINDMVSVVALGKAADTVRSYYLGKNIDNCGCIITPLGVNNYTMLNNAIEISPNPSSDFISVNYDSKTKHPDFEIMDVLGRVVSGGQGNQTKIDVSQLPSGLYLLKVTDGDLHFAKQFVKN